jgi:hypothetical protein
MEISCGNDPQSYEIWKALRQLLCTCFDPRRIGWLAVAWRSPAGLVG